MARKLWDHRQNFVDIRPHGGHTNLLRYEIYTDGACQPNPGIGGWAYLIRSTDENKDLTSDSGSEQETTNNRMELQSILKGLQFFADSLWTGEEEVTIFSDSQYAVKGINEWSDVWQANDWKKKDGKDLSNPDLWKKIWNLRNKLRAQAKHVRGHTGNKHNEIVDEMAVKAAKDAR